MSDNDIALGARAVEAGLISPEQLGEALRELWLAPSSPETLWQLLVARGLVDVELAATLERQVGGPKPKDRTSMLPTPASRYQFERHLGTGGMGVVRQVRDTGLGRSVAMKQLFPEAVEVDEQVGTLIAEAQVAGMLEHPNIMPIYDVGFHATGEPYYTMRLMDSMSLDDVLVLLRDGNPEVVRQYPLTRLMRIFQQVCMAVDYAHSRGVMHRDLKPENVRLGRFGEVQVADWGLARVDGKPDLPLQKALDDSAARGEHNPCIVIGSPNYMSPEQARGENDQTGAHSDIWALGAMLYEILTMHAPFEDTDTMVLLDRVERDPVIPPSELVPDRLIPPDLEEICMACLEKVIDERVPDVRVVWRAVEDHLEGRRRADHADTKAFEQIQRGQRYSTAWQRLREAVARLAGRVEGAAEPDRSTLARELQVMRLDMLTVWGEAWDAYNRALGFSESDLVARAKLAELAHGRLEDAERLGDELGCQFFFRQLARYNDGAWDAVVEGSGSITVHSEPAGATVHLRSFAHPSLDSRVDEARALGRTPLVLEDLEAGLYMLTLELLGARTVARPVFLRVNADRAVHIDLSE
ncbi:MAG: serine/threonine protein kinase [Myxococcota bacterium]|jgi:serine/threonine protein kinase